MGDRALKATAQDATPATVAQATPPTATGASPPTVLAATPPIAPQLSAILLAGAALIAASGEGEGDVGSAHLTVAVAGIAADGVTSANNGDAALLAGAATVVATGAFTRPDFADFASVKGDIFPDLSAAGAIASLNNAGPAGGTFTSTGTAEPTNGAGTGGHAGIAFDGTDDILDTTLHASALISASAYTFYAVVTVPTGGASSDNASVYNNDAILVSGTEYLGLHVSSVPKFQMYHFDGGVRKAEAAMPWDTPVLLQGRYDGSHIFARVGSASEVQGDLAGAIANMDQPWKLGLGNAGGSYLQFILHRLLVANIDHGAGGDAAIRARLGTLYNISV